MDMMEIPNLRQKATRFFSNVFAKVCLGLPGDMEPWLPKARRTFFFIFAVASYVYRWFVSFAILWFLYRFLVPYKLGTLSAMMAAASLGTLLVVPGYQLGKYLWESRRTSAVSKLRLSITILVLGAVAGVVFFVKFPYNVSASFVTAPEEPAYAFVEVPGVLREQFVKDGDKVRKGDTLALLDNPEKKTKLLDAKRLVFEHKTMARAYEFAGGDMARLERQQEKMALAYHQQATSLQQDLDRLTLIAERDGTVMQPPLPEKLGTYLENGPTPFCQIGDPDKLQVWLVIDQGYNEFVHEGQKVELKFYGHPLRDFDGEITEIPNVDVAHLPPELSNVAGGEIATKTDPKTGQQVPVHTLYYAVVPLDNPDLILQPGLRGKAKIKADPIPVGTRVWRWVKRTFHFDA
jgi:putative peptide zinc metalloprotease protein